MPRTTCPSCQLVQDFSPRSPVISGTPNGHGVALVQCDVCGFALLAYYAPRGSEIVHQFPRDVRCMTCDVAPRR